jgi:hypothetical protein
MTPLEKIASEAKKLQDLEIEALPLREFELFCLHARQVDSAAYV